MSLEFVINIHGNATFIVTTEVAEAIEHVTGYDIFPSTDPNDYVGSKFPYPLKKELHILVDLLSNLDVLEKDDYDRLKASLQEKDVEDKEQKELVCGVVETLNDYMSRQSLTWLHSQDKEEIPFDWLFSYLWISANLKENNFVFFNEDFFGETLSPCQVSRVSYHSGGLLTPPGIRVRYVTYHWLSTDSETKVTKQHNQTLIPYSPVINTKTAVFARFVDTSLIAQRNEKILSLLNQEVALPAKVPGSENRAFFYRAGFRRPEKENSFGTFLLSPEHALEFSNIYSQFDPDGLYTYKMSEIEGFQSWWVSRMIAAFHLDTSQTVLVPGDHLEKVAYDKTKIDKLILDRSRFLPVISRCKAALENTEVGDFYRGTKTNLILLLGVPGTGKTSSIEGICEYLETPLLRVKISSVGFNDAESYLMKLLTLAKSTNSFVLIDEADPILQRREWTASDSSRMQLVTKLLSLLERFPGLIFLTSNINTDDIDPAIKSRISVAVKFDFPEPKTLAAVWAANLQRVNFEVTDAQLEEITRLSHQKRIDFRGIANIASGIHSQRYYYPNEPVDLVRYIDNVL